MKVKFAAFLFFSITCMSLNAEPKTGEEIYNHWCSNCHDAGINHPGTHHLAFTRGIENSVLLERDNLSAEYIKQVVKNGLRGMPPFRPSEITDSDLEKLTDYMLSVD